MLDVDGAHLATLGSGGIGKTSIALSILHNPQIGAKFKEEDCHFISCETFTSGAHLVNALAQALSVKTLTSGPSDLDALILHLKQHYSACPLLLLLDNFETPWEIASAQEGIGHVLQCLCHIRQVTIVVTMRGYSPPGLPGMIDWVPLPMVRPLSLKAAKRTYCSICPTNDSSLEELLTQLDNVPLAIVLMAHVGQKGDSSSQLLKRWKEEHTAFLRHHSQDPSHLSSVEVSIRISLHNPSMVANPEAQQLLSLISLLPAGVLSGQLPAIVPSLSKPNEASDVL